MLWIVLVLGFVLTVIYIALSNSKQKNKYTILVALLMVASTLLLGLATNGLDMLLNGTDKFSVVDDSTSTSATDNPTIHTSSMPDYLQDSVTQSGTTEATTSSVNDTLELIAYEKDGKWGYVDNTGKVIIPFIYDTADDFREGLAAVRIEYSWGFIDKDGKTVIPFEYDGAWSFIDGLAPVYKDNLWGFINHNNEIVINFQYRNITKMNGAYFDENNNEIIY